MRRSNELGIFNGNVLVVEKGKIIYQAEFGSADASRSRKLTAAYRFNIGSITKEFSAVSIMILAEQGKLRLDDSVSNYLSGLPAWSQKVSIRNLLEFTSGLPELKWDTIRSDNDVLEDLKKVDTLRFEPGTKFEYTNNNVWLRNLIVAKITNMPFNRFIERSVYRPCKMNSSVVNPSSATKNIAKSFSDDLVQDPTDLYLSGIVYVTAGDLYKWTQCLHDGKVISKQSVSILGHGFNPLHGGLGRLAFDKDRLVLHYADGQSRNFEAVMQSDLDEGFDVILLDNNKNFKVSDIADAIRSILRGNGYKQPKKSIAKYLDKDLDVLNIDDLISLYNKLKTSRGNDFDFESDSDLNTMGYSLMNHNRIDDAIKLFALNCTLFPTSGNVFDSLGEAYLKKGDKKLALENYRKAVELDPKNLSAKEIIKQLEL